MLDLIIFSNPLSLLAGCVLGMILRHAIVGLVCSAAGGAILALVLSPEFLSTVSFEWLFANMILPAAAICILLGIVGAVIGIGLKAIASRFLSR